MNAGTGQRPLILHVITRLEAGGAPRSVLLLLEGLLREGLRVELAAGPVPAGGRSLDREAEAMGIPVHRIPALQRDPHPVRDLVALIQLVRLFRLRKPALVHLHTSKAGFLGRLAAVAARVPLRVYTPRGTILLGYFGPLSTRIFAALDRLAARWTDRIVGLTPEESASYVQAGIGRADQHQVIPIGFDASQVRLPSSQERSRARRREGVAEGEVLFVTAGRLVAVKDHATLLEGMAGMAVPQSAWRLWIFGSGPLEAELREAARSRGIGDRCRFWGHRDDFMDWLPLADVFVLNSVNEGFGRVLLEAMAARLAVVATRVGGVPTVLDGGSAGRLVPPGEPGTLAAACSELIEDPGERRRLADAGHRRLLEAFTSRDSLEQHIRMYERLMRRRLRHG